MNERARRPVGTILLPEVAALLGLSEQATLELVDAGYLGPAAGGRLNVGDVKAFQARVAAHPAGAQSAVDALSADLADLDPGLLLDALDGRAGEMARRSLEVYRTAFPDAVRDWTPEDDARFEAQSKARFETILAITAVGGDEDTVSAMADVGSTAAWAGSSLPQVLLMLRISRDIVVQTAVEVAEEHGRRWGLALSLLLTRILPAMDRLTDAVARGYWEAVVRQEEDARARHESVVGNASDGVYELDVDGVVRYANPAFAVIVGLPIDEIVGLPAHEVLVPAEEGVTIAPLLSRGGEWRHELTIRRPDGVCRLVQVISTVTRQGGSVVGVQGLVRDLTVATELERQKNEFLALVTLELRQPLTTILGLGSTLEAHGHELPALRLHRIGASIRRQAERVTRFADDLHDLSRIEAQSLQLTARTFRLADVLASALFSVEGGDDVRLDVDARLEVRADPRRLEQVVANLVENALVHGAAPVAVEAAAGVGDLVEIRVTDAGPGLPPGAEDGAFTRLHPADAGMGLSLVRGLVEAMGGRVRYERPAGGPTLFAFTVPTPRRVGEA